MIEQDIKSLEEGVYKSERHKVMVQDFTKKDVIVECLYGTADACYPRCDRFYCCWVERTDEENTE